MLFRLFLRDKLLRQAREQAERGLAGAMEGHAAMDMSVQREVFADLLLNIYRKYYGAKMALFLLGTFYVATVMAGYIVEFTFGGLGLIPDQADAKVPMEGITWNYTTWLNIAFLLLAAALLVRFFRTGGMAMLRMMGGAPGNSHAHEGHRESHEKHDGHR
ncbi:hypothetical protein ACFYXH_11780 [Streptomyces sp. NPDC002730]|uniref:hypothetical protein n=1 Tax=Streptomyces sp. NPDC002730 TaxID=3364662 RepID=UPI0036761CB4